MIAPLFYARLGLRKYASIAINGSTRGLHIYASIAINRLKLPLQQLLLQPDFFFNCELWRSRRVCEGIMQDV